MSVEYEIIKEYGTLSTSGEYTKEVNLVSWNDGEPKLDIRTWQPSGKPGKGISLNREEAESLNELLKDITF